MLNEIGLLLRDGTETIVRAWTDKVASDHRVRSDEQLTYLQLVNHVPQIIEELSYALAAEAPVESLTEGRAHGRQRWHYGYELKEVIRELILLRVTLMEFIETYRGALRSQSPEHLSWIYRKVSSFMDEELYKTVEAYLEGQRGQQMFEPVGV